MQHEGSSSWESRSKRITVLRFPLIVAVVFIHAYVVGEPVASAVSDDVFAAISRFVRNFISQGVARTAVPIFFLIAGYLFYRNFSLTRETYFSKLRSRVGTLLIPFFFWNIFTYAFFAAAQSLPQTSQYFTGSVARIAGLDPMESAAAILGIGREPISYQFWFVRDLMVAAVISPLLFSSLKRVPKTTLIASLLVWIGFNDSPSAEGFFFFVVGAAAAVHDVDLFVLDIYGRLFAVCYLPLVLIDVALWNGHVTCLHMVSMTFGVVAILYASKFLAARDATAKPLIKLSGASFFVFAAHEPLLTVCRKLVAKVLLAPGPMMGLIYYVVVPALIIYILVQICWALRRVAPRVARMVGAGPNGG